MAGVAYGASQVLGGEKVEIDGEEHVLPMDDPPIERLILSVRKIVPNVNYTTFRDRGGYIKNVKTGLNMRCVERPGVYLIQVRVKDPSRGEGSEGQTPTAGFNRPG